jgi:hypothetical protein
MRSKEMADKNKNRKNYKTFKESIKMTMAAFKHMATITTGLLLFISVVVGIDALKFFEVNATTLLMLGAFILAFTSSVAGIFFSVFFMRYIGEKELEGKSINVNKNPLKIMSQGLTTLAFLTFISLTFGIINTIFVIISK